MLEMRGLRQQFGAFALEIEQLEARRGLCLTIVGPSGSGKSLLLGIIAGIYPAQGRLFLDGRDLSALGPEQRELGFVFQRLSLFPHLSVRDNVEYGLRARRFDPARRRRCAEAVIESFKLGALLGTPVVALSGGESQRVAIARALAPEPQLLLLDEPLSSVDHNARLELQQLLRTAQRERQITLVHVTHDREEARVLGDDLAVMVGGQVVQQGTLAEVCARPVCLFVQRFLGLAGDPPPPPGCSESCLRLGRCDRPRGESHVRS